MSARIVVPGERLGPARPDQTPQAGTYLRGGNVVATVVGAVGADDQLSVQGKSRKAAIPTVGAQVTGKVKRINSRMAIVSIMMIGAQPVKEDFEGVIRVENVRATERDKVQIPKCFRPGDIVRAEVISLGEAHSYILSTAKNELGVIFAQSAAGATMIPISWEEMQCPETGAIENRKVCQIENTSQ
ncbi:Exosome complex component CSL4 [Allomyces javanicus]|nr:Exosome complex component CSL4 [Allomyces javanicus]